MKNKRDCYNVRVKPLFHPQLINGPFGDPGLYVDFLFERRALLFDLGDLRPLAPRKLLRLSDIFVSHMHMDHFIGLDHLVRLCLGRDKCLRLYGPPGFIDCVAHRLAGYSWNLVRNYENDFTLVVTEHEADGRRRAARFDCRNAFRREPCAPPAPGGDLLVEERRFRVRTTHLDHRIPSLAFALEEAAHVNVWKNRLDELGLPTGPWLNELKEAVMRGDPDGMRFRAWWRRAGVEHERYFTLGELRDRVLRIVPGQKIVYIADAVYHEENLARMVALARGADILFIESAFLERDAAQAAAKYHLTARQAGRIAGLAGVKRLVTYHYSARYQDEAPRLRDEALAAFAAARPLEPGDEGR